LANVFERSLAAMLSQLDSRMWFALTVTVLLGYLLYLLAPILTPFAVSALIAYLCDPLVDQLERRGFSRTTGVSLVFLAATLCLVLIPLILIPLLESQVSDLIAKTPGYWQTITTKFIPYLEQRFDLELSKWVQVDSLLPMLQEHWQKAGGIAAELLGGVSKSGLAILGLLANILLIPVVSFYLLRDWDILVARIAAVVPRPYAPTLFKLARESDETLGSFLRGQVSVMIVLGLIYAIGLSLTGLEFGLLIGMGAGLISFVPYLGGIVGFGVAAVTSLVQFHDPVHLLYVGLVFGIGQTIEGFVLTPWLVGDKIGLHPVAVIFSIMAFGQLFGFLGVLLALPAASILMVVLRHFHAEYLKSKLYAETVGEPPTVPL
jgi:predicted PurR-regulated permease PerM